jgi:predicted GIY-YIG superfamily endonuclease
MEEYVYVLKLEGKRYYIGWTLTPKERIKQHFEGNTTASKWTRKYKPTYVVDIIKGTKLDENILTLKYMFRKGWQNVRGGSYCQINMKIRPDAFGFKIKHPEAMFYKKPDTELQILEEVRQFVKGIVWEPKKFNRIAAQKAKEKAEEKARNEPPKPIPVAKPKPTHKSKNQIKREKREARPPILPQKTYVISDSPNLILNTKMNDLIPDYRIIEQKIELENIDKINPHFMKHYANKKNKKNKKKNK